MPLPIEAMLFSVLIFATVAFSRDFAHLHFLVNDETPYIKLSSTLGAESFLSHVRGEGFPIYATEVFLAIILVAIILRRWRTQDFSISGSWLNISLLAFCCLGVLEVSRGFKNSEQSLLVVRDFAIVYYIVCFYIAREVCLTWKAISWVLLAGLAGTILRIVLASNYYVLHVNFSPESHVFWPSLSRFMSGISGAYVSAAVLFLMGSWYGFSGRQRLFAIFYLSLAAFAFTLTQQRSLFIALIVGFGALMLGAKRLAIPKPASILAVILGGLIVGIMLWSLKVVAAQREARFLEPIKDLILKGACTVDLGVAPEQPQQDAPVECKGTMQFRRDAWNEAWARFLNSPVLGEGFGRPFVFYDSAQHRWVVDDVRPHNSYLTIVYKMGILGLASFAVIHGIFYKVLFRDLSLLPVRARASVLGLVAGITALQVYGLFNLLFESPFLADIYWSLMGIAMNSKELSGAPIANT